MESMHKNNLEIGPKDNILVAISELKEGCKAIINGFKIELKENIKQKHTFAWYDFNITNEMYWYC